jgi:hypothetical protein
MDFRGVLGQDLPPDKIASVTFPDLPEHPFPMRIMRGPLRRRPVSQGSAPGPWPAPAVAKSPMAGKHAPIFRFFLCPVSRRCPAASTGYIRSIPRPPPPFQCSKLVVPRASDLIQTTFRREGGGGGATKMTWSQAWGMAIVPGGGVWFAERRSRSNIVEQQRGGQSKEARKQGSKGAREQARKRGCRGVQAACPRREFGTSPMWLTMSLADSALMWPQWQMDSLGVTNDDMSAAG